MRRLLDRISLKTTIILAAFLGFAPFYPEPHVWQKLKMLMAGQLTVPLDIFDLLFHGSPWVLLALKLLYSKSSQGDAGAKDRDQ